MLFLALSGCLLLSEPPTSVKASWPAPALRLELPGEPLEGTVDIGVVVETRLDLELVELWIDGELAWEGTAASGSHPWDTTTAPAGPHTLRAVAVDELEREGEVELEVVTNNAPTVSITSPVSGDVVALRVPVTLETWDDGVATEATLLVDGVQVATDASPPLGFTWDTCAAGAGARGLTVSVEDEQGRKGEAHADVTVRQALAARLLVESPPPPTTIVGAYVGHPAAVAEVRFRLDGAELGVGTKKAAPTGVWGPCDAGCPGACSYYEAPWKASAASPGTHQVEVFVRDDAGATVTVKQTVLVDRDRDGDGYDDIGFGGKDCDDTAKSVHPGAAETCDAIDQDCDGVVDEGFDADADGHLSAAKCPHGDDCDDTKAWRRPGAPEVCNNLFDDNCDGSANACRRVGAVLLSAADARLAGGAADDWFGRAVAAGDLTGDGEQDVVVGAIKAASNDGRIYVFAGPVATSGIGKAAATVTGSDESAYFGASVDVGDMNGDGRDDLLGAATGSSLPGYYTGSYGNVYVLHGPLAGALDVSSAAKRWEAPMASLDYDFGYRAVLVGDHDGDGKREVLAAAPSWGYSGTGSSKPGRVYLLESGSWSDYDATIEPSCSSCDARLGMGLDAGGDTNRDGRPELLLGQPGYQAGKAFLFKSAPSVWVPSAASWTGLGAATGDNFGHAVAFAGDLDADGYDDVLIGAPSVVIGAVKKGAAYAFHGPLSGTRTAGDADARLEGVAADDRFGAYLSAAGDFDLDGYDDVLVSAWAHDAAGGADAGGAWLFYGPLVDRAASDPGVLYLKGFQAGAQAHVPAPLGDVSGDGYPDVALGAPSASVNGVKTGAVYLFWGRGI